MLNPNAPAFGYAYNTKHNPLLETQERLKSCQITCKDYKVIGPILSEWFSSSTLNKVLEKWEEHNKGTNIKTNLHPCPLTFILYNVQCLNARALEVVELIYLTDASVFILTEVGELWYKQKIPEYSIFHEKGTNKNGGVVIEVGKHLKASKIDANLKNTLIVDIFGLNEPLRVIGIYWPDSQKRNIDEITPFVTDSTIITGDFNASVEEWNSLNTDKRGRLVKNGVRKIIYIIFKAL
jgi:hypothetical protein